MKAMEELTEIIEKGWDIKVYNQVKRINGKFIIKTCWEAKNNDYKNESDWEGFNTAKEAIDDLITICAKISIN